MRKFNKLRRIIKMAKQQGKGSINKEYSVVTKKYQPYINMVINQIDIDDIIFNVDKKALILGDGFWLEMPNKYYLFCGYTALCVYMHLKAVGLDEVIVRLYGKRVLSENEQEDLREIRYS